MSEPHVLTRIDGNVYHVILNRPEKRNALTIELVDELARAVRAADLQPAVRAVVVSANGPVFSAGVDVMSLAQSRAEAAERNAGRWLRRLAGDLQHSLNDIESTELPVIGALHGRVIGLGLELALCFDFRVAGEDCQLSIPEARLGLVADVGGTTRLCRTVGPTRAKDLLMTCRSIAADEALQWGLVNRVAPADQVVSAAVELAGQIAGNAPLAVGMAKLIVDQGDGLDKQTQLALERWAQSQLITSDDVTEAMTAFMEKRPAEFKGR